MNQRKIMQTELRYRFQNLSSSFHSYQGMWDRIQREMDEGRYHRQKINHVDQQDNAKAEVEKIYLDYQNVCRQCQRPVPQRAKLELFINQQRENIRKKYGNVECVFRIINDNGKPKITASLKR